MIFNKPTKDQLLALSGIFQSCHLVEQLSKHGLVSEKELKISVESLLHKDSRDTLAMFRSSDNLNIGIESMQDFLNSSLDIKASETLRYAIGTIYLAKKLRSNEAMSLMVRQRLDKCITQAEYFSATHSNVISNIAQIYQDSFGALKYRITVHGCIDHLGQKGIVERVRCLLFSAIRSAMLFHQLGGRGRHIIFNKRYILSQTKALNMS
ncbi:MAG: high frequency lysogenization protein [Porticoccus sp.]